MGTGGLAVLAIIVVVVMLAGILYNRLVSDRNQVRQGYADIDVQLKRRADLVPQLVEVVRGYAAYEKALLTTITELRGSALRAEALPHRFNTERELGVQLRRLVLLQENYPQLKADASFRDFAAKLVEVEDHLQYARRFYNGAVKQFLTRIESFPDAVVARLCRFRPMPFFETDDRAPARVTI